MLRRHNLRGQHYLRRLADLPLYADLRRLLYLRRQPDLLSPVDMRRIKYLRRNIDLRPSDLRRRWGDHLHRWKHLSGPSDLRTHSHLLGYAVLPRRSDLSGNQHMPGCHLRRHGHLRRILDLRAGGVRDDLCLYLPRRSQLRWRKG